MQFALHYSWSTEARARRALANVSALLRPGGTFIGTMPDANVIIKKLREGLFYTLKLFYCVLESNAKNRNVEPKEFGAPHISNFIVFDLCGKGSCLGKG